MSEFSVPGMRSTHVHLPQIQGRTLLVGACIAAAAVFVGGAFFTVPQTHVAFVTRFGQVVNPSQPLGPGLHFKIPLVDGYDMLSTTTDTFTLPEKIVLTKDTQELTLQAGVTYRKPPSAAYHLLYEVGKAGDVDIHSNIVALFNEVERDVVSTYSVTEIGGEKRQEVVTKIKDAAAEKLAQILKIEISDVQLPVLDMPKTYKEAASAAATSRTKMLTAQQDAERSKTEAQTTVTQAKAMADASVSKARGDAEAALARAQAEANGNLAKAEAEAKGIRLKGEAEASAIAAKVAAVGGVDGYIRQLQAQAGLNWKGEVPHFSLGGNGTGVQMPIVLPLGLETKR